MHVAADFNPVVDVVDQDLDRYVGEWFKVATIVGKVHRSAPAAKDFPHLITPTWTGLSTFSRRNKPTINSLTMLLIPLQIFATPCSCSVPWVSDKTTQPGFRFVFSTQPYKWNLTQPAVGNMDTRDAAAEAAKLVLQIGSAAADALLFVADLGEELPFINPVLKTLRAVREKLETVKGNRRDLEALHERCTYITACVIEKCRRAPSEFDVTPLVKCVEAVESMVERCGRRGRLLRVLKAYTVRNEMAELNARMDRLTGDLGLAGIAILESMGRSQAASQEQILANQDILIGRLPKPAAKLAKVPKGTPTRKSWHVERHQVMESVLEALTDKGGLRLVGVVGASGAGKTTIASEIVRSTRAREFFSGGKLWLSVNTGSKERLPSLMLQLACLVHQEIEGSGGRPPAASDDSVTFIRQRVEKARERKGLKCLVVADNVRDSEAISKLLETGMWVLISTRDEQLVQNAHGEAVVVDELSEADAEMVLKRAAELPPSFRLPDEAVDLIELCGRVAMDLAFVGRWSTVRGRQDRTAWSDAAGKVRAEMKNVQIDSNAENVVENLSKRRKAVLQAGFEDLATGSEDGRVPRLYLSLTVMPDGHVFTVSDAAVLLYDRTPSAEDEASVATVVDTLERWTVVHSIEGAYRMHDAHSSFARENLMSEGNVRRSALKRWVGTISSLDALRSTDPFHLKGRWQAVEAVGGDSCDTTRPYLAALAMMDDSDPLLRKSIEAMARFQGAQDDWKGASTSWRRLLEVEKRELGADHPRVLNTLRSLGDCAARLGDVKQAEEWHEKERQALPLVLTKMELQGDGGGDEEVDDADGLAYLALTMLTRAPEKQPEAEELLRRSLEIQEAKLGREDLGVAHTLHKLAECVGNAGKYDEAESLLKRCLGIREAKLGREDLGVAYTLYVLGVGARRAGRLDEAEELWRRCLQIRETKLGREDLQVSYTLYNLGECLLREGRLEEAEESLRRCLGTQEASLGPTHEQVATTLDTLGACVREAGRFEEAEVLSRRSLEIVRMAQVGMDPR